MNGETIIFIDLCRKVWKTNLDGITKKKGAEVNLHSKKTLMELKKTRQSQYINQQSLTFNFCKPSQWPITFEQD